MGLILLEALVALLVLVFIVWWTMFAGRRGGEPPADDAPTEASQLPAKPSASKAQSSREGGPSAD